jgi:hypothetical protein
MATHQITSLRILCARLAWILVGPIALVFLTFAIVKMGGGWLVAADIAFFCVLAAMLLGRWIEYRSGQGETASGEPMMQSDLRRYLLATSAVGLAVWVAANLVANQTFGV